MSTEAPIPANNDHEFDVTSQNAEGPFPHGSEKSYEDIWKQIGRIRGTIARKAMEGFDSGSHDDYLLFADDPDNPGSSNAFMLHEADDGDKVTTTTSSGSTMLKRVDTPMGKTGVKTEIIEVGVKNRDGSSHISSKMSEIYQQEVGGAVAKKTTPLTRQETASSAASILRLLNSKVTEGRDRRDKKINDILKS